MTKKKEEEPAAPEAERDRDIAEIMAQIPGEGARITLYKENPKKPGQFDWCDEFDAASFSLPGIRDAWGGGKYRARAKNAKGGWLQAFTFTVAEVSAKGMAGVSAGGTGGGSNAMSERFDKLMLLMMERMMAPPPDPIATMTTLAGLMRPTADPIDTAVRIAALMKQDSGGGGLDAAAKMMETFQKGMELGRSLDAVAESDSFMPVLREAMPVLSGVVARALDREKANPSADAGPSRPITQADVASLHDVAKMPVKEQLAPSSEASVNPHMKALAPIVPKILGWAARGLSPETYAEVVLDQIPEWAVEIVATEAAKETFAADVFQQFPQLKAHGKWVSDFLAEIKALLIEPVEEGAAASASETPTDGEIMDEGGGDA